MCDLKSIGRRSISRPVKKKRKNNISAAKTLESDWSVKVNVSPLCFSLLKMMLYPVFDTDISCCAKAGIFQPMAFAITDPTSWFTFQPPDQTPACTDALRMRASKENRTYRFHREKFLAWEKFYGRSGLVTASKASKCYEDILSGQPPFEQPMTSVNTQQRSSLML